MSTELRLPDFESEAEEAKWYDAHRDELGHDSERGDGRPFGRVLLEDHGLILDPNAITLSLPEGDLSLARSQALMHGVDSERYLAELLHQALQSRAA